MGGLSGRTGVVYAFVRDTIAREGVAPTVREIAEGTYFAVVLVAASLEVLEARGLITRTRTATGRVKARSLRLAVPTDGHDDRRHDGM